MRISDWSSDVCSSDLILFTLLLTLAADLASNYVRALLRGDATRAASGVPQAHRASVRALRVPLRPWYAVAFIIVVLIWTLWFMGWGNQAGRIGSASSRERGCQSVKISVGSVTLKKKYNIKVYFV